MENMSAKSFMKVSIQSQKTILWPNRNTTGSLLLQVIGIMQMEDRSRQTQNARMKQCFRTKTCKKRLTMSLAKIVNSRKVVNLKWKKRCLPQNHKKLTFMELISDKCYNRIFNIKITSIEMVAIVGCSYEHVRLPGNFLLSKVNVASILSMTDIICILVIQYMFSRLKYVNNQFLEIMDANLVKMSSFTI